jgi:tetratricopeptide (TPR) repeat protein
MSIRQFIIVAGLLAAASAHAGDRAKARELFEEGTRRYNLGEYNAALGRFRAAYDEVADPTLLYNTAQCYRQLGDRGKAATLYRSYLREVPDAVNAAEVRRLIVTLDAEVLREQATRTRAPEGTITPTVTQPAPRWWRNRSGWALAGAGAGVALIGVGLAGGSLAVDANARAATTLDQQRDLHGRAQALEIGGWAVLGAGAAVAVIGVVLLATRQPRGK